MQHPSCIIRWDKFHYQQFTPPFEIPDSWKWVTLNDVGEIITGNTPSKDVEDYYGGDIPFYKPTDLSQGINTQCSYDTLTPQGFELSRKLPVDSILITCIGATIGKTGLIKRVGSCNQQINAIIPNKGIIPEYVYYCCNSLYFQNCIKRNASSTTLPILNKNSFVNLSFPLPPTSEQVSIVKAINDFLSIVDAIESSTVELTTAIGACKSKILDLAMQGKLVEQDLSDEPAAEMLRRINPKAKIITDNPQCRNMPLGWSICQLRDLCSFLSRGKSPKYSNTPNLYPVFAQKCNLKDGGISLYQARFLDETTISKWSEKYHLKEGDILVNSTGTGTVGRTRIFKKEYLGKFPFVVPDSHVSVVRTFDEINPYFVFYCLYAHNCQEYFADNLAGSTNQKELYIDVIGDTLVMLPPLNEQKRIVAKIEELYSVLDEIESSLQS